MTDVQAKKMEYGKDGRDIHGQYREHELTWTYDNVVRLGTSGLKVSKIILGTMQYGDKGWQDWVLEEEEAIEHIKFA